MDRIKNILNKDISKWLNKNKIGVTTISIFALLAFIGVVVTYAYYQVTDQTKVIGASVTEIPDIELRIYAEERDANGNGLNTWSIYPYIPQAGYVYNASKSYCVNGSTLTYNSSTYDVDIATSGNELCYMYFDSIAQLDITISVMAEDIDNNGEGTGTYTKLETTALPSAGYQLSSYTCSNGTTVSYDEQTNLFTVNATGKDTCTIWMDAVDPDISLKIFTQASAGSSTYNEVDKINGCYTLRTGAADHNSSCTGTSTLSYEYGKVIIGATSKTDCVAYLDIAQSCTLRVTTLEPSTPTCNVTDCGQEESVIETSRDSGEDTYTVYTVGYVESDSTTGVTYTINIENAGIDFKNYKLVLDGTPAVMTTQNDFNNYVAMKQGGEPATSLAGGNTTSAVATAQELYTYSLGTNELTIDSVQVSCNSTKCTATIRETFSGLSGKTKHSTTTNGGDSINVLYNGIKFNLKKVEKVDYTCHNCKYWNNNYNGNNYASTSMSTGTGLNGVYDSRELLASAYSNFANRPIYIRTSIENGTPTGHEACLWYNNAEFCLGPGYWTGTINTLDVTEGANTEAKLKADMEEKLDITLYNSLSEAKNAGVGRYYCYSGSDSAGCYVGSLACYADYDGGVGCEVGSAFCYVYGSGTARCRFQ